MKKFFFVFIIAATVIAMSSCDYDDSNDIDLLNPNDTTQTSAHYTLNR